MWRGTKASCVEALLDLCRDDGLIVTEHVCWTGQGHSKVAQGCAQVDYLIRRSRHRGSWEAVSRQQQNASQLLDERLDENLRASYVQSGPQAIASAVEEEPEQGDDDAEVDDENAGNSDGDGDKKTFC